ncbi:MAG: NUDIX hydrolase [Candidatus Paceibacterota bacterium]
MKKEIYKGKYIAVFLEENRGKIRERVYLKDSVNVVLVNNKKNIFLINESRWENHNRKSVKILSGLVEENESPSSCVKREIFEETGISDIRIKKIFTHNKQGTINQKKHFYIVYIKNEKDIDLNILCKFSKKKLEEKIKQNYFGLTTTGSLMRIIAEI